MAKNRRPRIFKTPEDLKKAFDEYKEDLKEQSKEWQKTFYVGKDGDEKKQSQKVPMSFDGFEVFCYEHYGCVGQYFKNKNDVYKEFIPLCTRIKKEIRANQIIGGMLGFYNPSITQRLNSLTEQTKTDLTTNGKEIIAPIVGMVVKDE